MCFDLFYLTRHSHNFAQVLSIGDFLYILFLNLIIYNSLQLFDIQIILVQNATLSSNLEIII